MVDVKKGGALIYRLKEMYPLLYDKPDATDEAATLFSLRRVTSAILAGFEMAGLGFDGESVDSGKAREVLMPLLRQWFVPRKNRRKYRVRVPGTFADMQGLLKAKCTETV